MCGCMLANEHWLKKSHPFFTHQNHFHLLCNEIFGYHSDDLEVDLPYLECSPLVGNNSDKQQTPL